MSTLLDATVRTAIKAVVTEETFASALDDESALDNYMLKKLFN
jgi:hypothetical protein